MYKNATVKTEKPDPPTKQLENNAPADVSYRQRLNEELLDLLKDVETVNTETSTSSFGTSSNPIVVSSSAGIVRKRKSSDATPAVSSGNPCKTACVNSFQNAAASNTTSWNPNAVVPSRATHTYNPQNASWNPNSASIASGGYTPNANVGWGGYANERLNRDGTPVVSAPSVPGRGQRVNQPRRSKDKAREIKAAEAGEREEREFRLQLLTRPIVQQQLTTPYSVPPRARPIRQSGPTGVRPLMNMDLSGKDNSILSNASNFSLANAVNGGAPVGKEPWRMHPSSTKGCSPTEPWYLYPFNVCWDCRRSLIGNSHAICNRNTTMQDLIKWVYMVNGLLWNICFKLRIPNLGHLLEFAQSQQALLQIEQIDISPQLWNAMKLYDKVNSIESPPEKHYWCKPPNCVAALIHKDVIKFFIHGSHMKPEDRSKVGSRQLRDFSGNFVNEPVPVNFPGVNMSSPLCSDAHFYLDKLLKETGRGDYDSAVRRFRNPKPIIMDFMVASYSCPSFWPTASIRDRLERDPRIKIAVGWNPQWCGKWTENLGKNFRAWLHMRDVKAAGEIGLEYRWGISLEERQKQTVLLNKLLPIVFETGLSVIIQCKQPNNDIDAVNSAVTDCIKIMRNYLPPGYPIYITGFNGGPAEYDTWNANFTNVRFGISPVILDRNMKNPLLDNVVEKMKEWQILLETNVPLFTPHNFIVAGQVAHPDLLGAIADKVASIRQSHRVLVMDASLKATRAFFRC